MRHVRILAALLLTACTANVGDGPTEDVDGGVASDAAVASDATTPTTTGPARYFADQMRSPITSSVVASLREIYGNSSAANDLVFMKVGASGTVSSRFLDCFSDDAVDLDGRTQLQATIDYYDMATASGASSWQRNTIAAMVGRSASWVISGNPSPLDQEIAAINPRIALVNYGTNDMSLGITNETALWPFHTNFTALLDELQQQGIIPIITGLNPRTDDETAARWVPTYNAVTRAIAEARQLPYINLYLASVGLPDQGLVADGIHGNSFGGGACVFTAEGLQFNYNARNLLTLQVVDKVKRVAIDNEDGTTPQTTAHAGTGSPTAPFVIDRLPFTHTADTSTSPHSLINAYPACDTGQNESGPELYYRLDLTTTTALRVMLLDRGNVDVDLHVMAGSADAENCGARDHRILEGTLTAGTYYFSVDSFVGSGGDVRSGRYSLVVVPCEPGDTRCD